MSSASASRYATDRPGNLRVVVQRHNQAIAIAIAHTLKHQLQSRRESKRPKGASLRAATAREEAHPPIRPQRRNVSRCAVRREQEEDEQLREVSSAETQERKPGDLVEGVAKVNFHNNPTRVTLKRQPHGGREDLDATRHAHAQLRRPNLTDTVLVNTS